MNKTNMTQLRDSLATIDSFREEAISRARQWIADRPGHMDHFYVMREDDYRVDVDLETLSDESRSHVVFNWTDAEIGGNRNYFSIPRDAIVSIPSDGVVGQPGTSRKVAV